MTEEEAAELPPYKLEAARSSRSKCRTCRRKIDKDKLRLGVLLDGYYGPGYVWHHLTCAAKRRADEVEEAYAAECWEEGLEVPPLDELRSMREEAERAKAERKLAPYVERDPSGRAKCKHCGEPIEKGAWRVGLLREVEFGRQVRSGVVMVHAHCVAAEIHRSDCATEVDGFEEAVRENSRDVEESDVSAALTVIGELD